MSTVTARTYDGLLSRVIDDGIEAARADYAEKDMKRKGAVAGFEACRGKTPEQLGNLLMEAQADAERAGRGLSEDYWYWRCRELEIEWTCNVISAVMLNQGMAPVISPTARGVMKAAEIVGVAKSEEPERACPAAHDSEEDSR